MNTQYMMEPHFQPDQEYSYERIKAKTLYKHSKGGMKYQLYILRQKSKMYRNILIGILFLVLVIVYFAVVYIGIYGLFFGTFALSGLVFVYISYSAFKNRTRSMYKRLSILGILSRSFVNTSYKITSKFNTFRSDNLNFIYRETRSPYSNARKRYFYNPWTTFDTNIKHDNPNIDGIKFKLDSFIKMKTKNKAVVREIVTIKLKLFFRINSTITPRDLERLTINLSGKITIPYFYDIDIYFPSDNEIAFKLKLETNMKEFHASIIPSLVQNYFSVVRNSYYSVFGEFPIPLKDSLIIEPERIDLKTKKPVKKVKKAKKAEKITPVATISSSDDQKSIPEEIIEKKIHAKIPKKEIQVTETGKVEDTEFNAALKRLRISIGEYVKDGKKYTFNPKYGTFTSIILEIQSDKYFTSYTGKDQIRKKLLFDLDIQNNTINYHEGSDQLSSDFLGKYRLKRYLEKFRENKSIENITVSSEPSTKGVFTVVISIVSENAEHIYDIYDFAKSLIREFRYS